MLMSIARPCPYSEDKEFCKYEKYMGEPNTKMCEKCSRRVPKPEPPKLEMVKEVGETEPDWRRKQIVRDFTEGFKLAKALYCKEEKKND